MSKWNLDCGATRVLTIFSWQKPTTESPHVLKYKVKFSSSFFSCFLSAWLGHPSPAAWARQSPLSIPTRRPSSSLGTSARRSSKASARSTRGRPSDISGNAPCTPSPNLWTFIPARPRKAAGKLPYLLTLWT